MWHFSVSARDGEWLISHHDKVRLKSNISTCSGDVAPVLKEIPWMLLVVLVSWGVRPCFLPSHTVSPNSVSCWHGKEVCGGKHASAGSDCVLTVVSAALKIEERASLWGSTHTHTQAHVEETPLVVNFHTQRRCMRCIQIGALKGMHMLTEIYGIYVCMHTDTHAQTHKLWSSSFKWGIGSHGNQIWSCRSHSTCHKMGNQQHAEMPDLHPVFLQHTFRHIMRCTHTHAQASPPVLWPWAERWWAREKWGGAKQNERKAEEAKMGEETRERAKGTGGHDGGTGAEHRGDSRAVRRMGDAVGIISKLPLYPGGRTEEPVCMCVCVCFGFCTCCSGASQFFTTTYINFKWSFSTSGSAPHPTREIPWDIRTKSWRRFLDLAKKKMVFKNSNVHDSLTAGFTSQQM